MNRPLIVFNKTVETILIGLEISYSSNRKVCNIELNRGEICEANFIPPAICAVFIDIKTRSVSGLCSLNNS